MKQMIYESPAIEVIEIETEGAVLSTSGVESTSNSITSLRDGGRSW